MTVAQLPALPAPEAVEAENHQPDALISMLWVLPDAPPRDPADAAASAALVLVSPPPARLLRAREGVMSEQAGVIAEIYMLTPPGIGSKHDILLLELLTLQPLGRASLPITPTEDDGDCLSVGGTRIDRRAPTVVSIQRRSSTSWMLVLEVRAGAPPAAVLRSTHSGFSSLLTRRRLETGISGP